MKHARIELSSIKRSDSARATNPSVIESLAASMNQIGLLQPITVTPSQIFDGVMKSGYRLIAGNHRFLSAEKLGWTEIDAIVVEGSSLESELIEIDENLCRAELSPAQRASSIKRRKQVWEALHPETAGTNCSTSLSDGRKAGPQHEQGFAAETAAVSGQSKQDVNRHIARAEALGDDIDEVVGTSLDKGVELDALKKLPEPERKELIERAKAGEQVSARVETKKPSAKLSGSAGDTDALISRLECTAALIKKFPSVDHAVDWAAELNLSEDARLALRFFADLDGAMVTA